MTKSPNTVIHSSIAQAGTGYGSVDLVGCSRLINSFFKKERENSLKVVCFRCSDGIRHSTTN